MSNAETLMRGTAVLLMAFTVLPSCRKPKDAVKSDLVEAGYQLTAPDLLRAAAHNDVPALKKFVSGGFAMDSTDPAGDSALHAAAAAGARDSADFLLTRGLSLDRPGASNRTPLMAAVVADQTEMVRWLLRQGADPRLKDADGFSALMLGVREGRAPSVGELAPYHRESLDAGPA
jgi:ankyrin repeat protein